MISAIFPRTQSTAFRLLLGWLTFAFVPCLCAEDADIAAALKGKGAEITETKGVATGVSFRDCTKFAADDFASLGKLTKLRQVSLGAGANDATLRALGAPPELEVLSTNGLDLTDDGVRLIAAFKKLKNLALFHPGKNFTGAGLDALAEIPLESLTVAGSTQFADEGMAAVGKLKGLKGFRTWHTGVTLAGVKQLAGLKNLTSLTLGQRLSYKPPTTLADDCLPVLAELSSLESLSLGEARLSLQALSQLKKLPKLKRLVLDGVEISESDFAALKTQLSNVDVKWTKPSDVFRKRIDALFGPAN